MAFRFSLQAVLRLRATVTHQEELRLESISHQLSLVRQQLEATRLQQRQLERSLNAQLKRGTQAGELQLKIAGLRGLRETEKRLLESIVLLERAWNEQLRKFNKARQEEEVLQSVRDNQFETYQEEQRRREQQMVDELFSARIGRRNAPKADSD